MPILYEQVFSKSPEKAVTAQKKPTSILFDLWLGDPPIRGMGTIISGTTQTVGTKITLSALLRSDGKTLPGKEVDFYHKINGGAWAKDATVVVDTYGYAEIGYSLPVAGTHTWYAEFKGDAEYHGCAKAVKAFAH